MSKPTKRQIELLKVVIDSDQWVRKVFGSNPPVLSVNCAVPKELWPEWVREFGGHQTDLRNVGSNEYPTNRWMPDDSRIKWFAAHLRWVLLRHDPHRKLGWCP